MLKKKELTAAIGKTFTQLREAKNIKREYVAEQCSKKYSAVAKFEQGKADAGMAQVIMYLATMGIDIQEFVAMYERNLPPPPRMIPMSGMLIIQEKKIETSRNKMQ